MATKGKDSSSNSSLRKEKKVTPSSNSQTVHKQTTNPKSAATSSSINNNNNFDHKVKSSTKPVPNYLKPTLSSRSDSSSKPVNNNKKSLNNIISNEDATQKLLRRRSFDRPPSAARLQKSHLSPDPKDRLFKASTPPIRSSSFSSKLPISTSSKSKFLTKPVKSQQHSETVNRSSSSSSRVSSTSVSKNSSTPSHSSKAPNIIPDRTRAPVFNNTETEQEIICNKQSNLLVQEEAEENVEREAVKEDADALEDDTQIKDNVHEKVVNPTEIISVVAEGQTSLQVSQVKETECHEFQENQNKHEQEDEEENHHIHSSHNHNLDQEGVADNVVEAESEEEEEEGEEEEEMNVNEKEASSEETIEENKEDMEQYGNNEGSDDEELIDKSKELGEDHHVVMKDAKVEGEEEEGGGGKQEVANEVQQPQDKKETPPTAYNDVIEKTKNKLLESRKNKVKALVGAFETVIDYETAAGSK